ncbi:MULTISPECIES: hypothetical protein [Nocardia]|uniref:hypothetical protein n=1 Tax=Nocardia TaxID=1817 RepID=UPI000D694FBF|nr:MULTISPECIES: hypothetical protein [Nocardia]
MKPVVYVLESHGDGEESADLEGIFTSIEKAQAYMDAFLGRALDWKTTDWGWSAHVVHPLGPGCDYHSVDAYYIRAHTVDPEPGDDDE